MTAVLDQAPVVAPRPDDPDVIQAVGQMLGQTPLRIDVERIHFPGKRPVQMALRAQMPDGAAPLVWAEYRPEAPHEAAQQARASLRKSRNGQKSGLGTASVLVAGGTGLVLRSSGLDERLPGLRLLYDAAFARAMLRDLLGEDPGPVATQLVAHRLGKRAVLRMDTDLRTLYVRLRAIKSPEGLTRQTLHQRLWAQLAPSSALQIPEPIGTLPAVGASFFGVLDGRPADFGVQDSEAIARALAALQRSAVARLPIHSGADEARLLADWLNRCRQWRPALARRIEPGLRRVQDALAHLDRSPAPCHRDLHEKQILIGAGGAGFLDFDTLCLSHPSLDAGNLLAHLFFAGIDEAPLRNQLEDSDLDLWRRAALFRLCMIYAFTTQPDAVLDRLITETTEC